MEFVFESHISELLGIENCAQILMNKVREQCDFSYLYTCHAEHAIHLESNLIKLFVETRMFYHVKFFNRDVCPRNKKCNKKMARIIHK